MRMTERLLVTGNCDLCVKRPAVNQIDNSFLGKRIKLCGVCVKLIAYSEVEKARKEGAKQAYEKVKKYLLERINRPNARADIWCSEITKWYEEDLRLLEKELKGA